MDIRPDMTGTIGANAGGAVQYEEDRLSFVRSPDGKRLRAAIVSMRFMDDKGNPIPNPDRGDSSAIPTGVALD